MHGCVTTRGRGRQGDIWATAKTLVVAPSMPGINIYVLGVYNPGFFLSEIGWGGGGGCLSRFTGEAGEKILLAGKRGVCVCLYIYIYSRHFSL